MGNENYSGPARCIGAVGMVIAVIGLFVPCLSVFSREINASFIRLFGIEELSSYSGYTVALIFGMLIAITGLLTSSKAATFIGSSIIIITMGIMMMSLFGQKQEDDYWGMVAQMFIKLERGAIYEIIGGGITLVCSFFISKY